MSLIRKLITGTALTVSYCLPAQTQDLPGYLSADAKTVIQINLPSLASKMSWQELQELSFFKQAMNDAPADMQAFLKNPASTGINFFSGLFIVMMPPKDPETKPSAVLYGQIADTAKFRAMVQKIDPKTRIRSAGKINMLVSGKNSIAWTPELFAIPLSKNKGGKPAVAPANKTPDALAKQTVTQLQTLLSPSLNPLSKNVHFTSLMKETGDIRFWVNRNTKVPKTKKNNKADELLKMMNWSMMQNGNYMTGVVRFENGRAISEMKTYMNATMDSLYRLYPSKKMNTALLKKFPSGQPLALLSINMSPDLIAAMFKQSGAEKILDSIGRKSSTKPLEIIKALNGDMALAVIQSKDIDEKDSVTQALKGIQFFVGASVKDKSKLEPLLAELKKPKEPKLDEEGNEIKPGGPLGGMKPAFLLNDSFFVMSLSSFAAEKFLASSAENAVTGLAAPYTNYACLFSLDLKTIIGFAMQMSKKKPAGNDEETARLLNTFEKLVFYGGDYQNGSALSAAELQFSNKDENSLKQFVKLAEMGMNMGLKKKSSSYTPEESEDNEETATDEEAKELPPPPPPKPKAAPKKKIQ